MTDYTDIYKDGGIYDSIRYGAAGVSKGLKFSQWLSPNYPEGIKVLCVGCGCGYEVVHWLKEGKDAYGTELHNIDVPILKDRIIHCISPELPFKDDTFDLLMCCEVLEHIEEELSESFIIECGRVAKEAFFSIATKPDPPWNTHINLHDIDWWYKIFEKNFEIKNIQQNPRFSLIPKVQNTHCFTLMRIAYKQGIIAHVSKNI